MDDNLLSGGFVVQYQKGGISVDETIKTLQQWIDESRAIVLLGGAAESAECGIPAFHSVDGPYNHT